MDDHHSPFQPGTIKLEAHYDLGEIKNTTPFTFDFSNLGDTDIWGITISSSNNLFVVEPSDIAVLKPRSGQSLNQPLKVFAVHGRTASGISPAEFMPIGPNQTTLTVRGRTTDAKGDTLRISQQTTMEVFARLADIELYDVDKEFLQDTIWHGNSHPSIGGMLQYTVANGPIRVLNTGNVTLKVSMYRYQDNEGTHVELSEGEEASFERENEILYFRIDLNDNSVSPELSRLESNGLVHFAVGSVGRPGETEQKTSL